MKELDGREYKRIKLDNLRSTLKFRSIKPCLAIITTTGDSASQYYVKTKMDACVSIGASWVHINLSKNISLSTLKTIIESLNNDPTISGIIVQKPLNNLLAYAEDEIDNLISPNKDVDGFIDSSDFVSCTPLGIIELLKYNNISFEGKNVVIAGRSKIVGKPLNALFMSYNCTVTNIHSHTNEGTVKRLIEDCDIFVSAIGSPNYWTKEYFETSKKKLALIDVGINRIQDENGVSSLVGDCDPSCYPHFKYYTPVPGGVGQTTVASLMSNLYKASMK